MKNSVQLSTHEIKEQEDFQAVLRAAGETEAMQEYMQA